MGSVWCEQAHQSWLCPGSAQQRVALHANLAPTRAPALLCSQALPHGMGHSGAGAS